MFQRCVLSPSSGMMEAVCTSETSVDNHFTWQYIPEDNSEQSWLSLFKLYLYIWNLCSKCNNVNEMWDSHGGEDVIVTLLHWTVRELVGRYQHFVETSSVLGIEAVCSSEMLVSTYTSTWHYVAEDQHRIFHCRGNLKSHMKMLDCLSPLLYFSWF
jgi:hypothetical protein